MERQAIFRAEPRLRSSVRVLQATSSAAVIDDRPDAVTFRKLSDAMHDSPRVAAQRKLIGTMAASTAQRAAILGCPRAAIVQRSVDPDFPTYHAVANPGVQPTIPEMKTFFDKFVANEAARLRELPIEDDLLTAMNNAVLYATIFFEQQRTSRSGGQAERGSDRDQCRRSQLGHPKGRRPGNTDGRGRTTGRSSFG